ncbi:MAG: DNA-binding protein WhiA [Ruminococcus sp.]|nr:DNA-binding protein WhiA [Ruminococcus sp.]MBR6671112.1 DNA-binding protein WhiA [Ruminococcus sp.]
MLLYSKNLNKESIILNTENEITATIFPELVYKVFGDKVKVKIQKSNSHYTCIIDNEEQVQLIYNKYFINPDDRSINQDIIVNNSFGIFAAGIFLSCGSVNDPSKEYHLEFAAPCELLAQELKQLLLDIGVNAKIFIRKNMYIVYIKGSESIEDTLTFMGAQQCTIELMNVKIFKDVRNKANRIANCDSANIDKVINAALKQIEDIKIIESKIGLENLSDELREIAELRLENTDMSLQEIGNSLKIPISRSGVNHRFKKLAKIADEIRGEMKNEKQ